MDKCIWFALLALTLGACTKTETVEVEKVVEKIVEVPMVEAPGHNSTVSEQPASAPIVIATGSDMEVDTTGTSEATPPQPTPLPPIVEPVPQTTSAPSVSPPLIWLQYLTGIYTAIGNKDGKGTLWWAKDEGISDLTKVTNLAAYSGTPASAGMPYGMTMDPDARLLYFSEGNNAIIRKLDLATGQVTTLAGGRNPNNRGTTDGVGRNALFNLPRGLALSPDKKYLFIVDSNNHTIRRLTLDTTVVTLFAGVPLSYGLTDGPRVPAFTDAASVLFNKPQAVVAAPDGKVYVADTGNHAIRVIAPDTADKVGDVTTLIKSTDMTNDPFTPDQMVLEGDTLYVAGFSDTPISERVVWKIDIPSKTKTVLAGTFKTVGLVATDASVSAGCPAAPDPNRPECVYGTQAKFQKLSGIIKIGNRLYVSDYALGANNIYEIDLDKSALVTRIIGVPPGGGTAYGTTDGYFKDTRLRSPAHMAYDPVSNALFVAEEYNNMIRRLDLGTQQSAKAHGFIAAYTQNADTDVVPPLETRFAAAWHMAFLDDSKILVADQTNCRVRLITLDPEFGSVMTDAAGQRKFNNGNMVSTFAGKQASCNWTIPKNKLPLPHPETDANGPGEFYWPQVIAVSDDKAFAYVGGSKVIQKINLANPSDVKVVAGKAHTIASTDGVGQNATFSVFNDMRFVSELQPDGSTKPALYVLDGDAIRRVSLSEEDYKTVTTVAGSNERVGHVDGVGPEAAFLGAWRMTYVKRGAQQYLYVTERAKNSGAAFKPGNNDVREVLLIDNGEKKYAVKTVAGSGLDDSRDGNGLKASFNWPSAIGTVVNADGTAVLYVMDAKSYQLRKIDLQTLDVTTAMGSETSGFTDGIGAKASWTGAESDFIYNAKHNRLFFLDTYGAIRLLGPELP